MTPSVIISTLLVFLGLTVTMVFSKGCPAIEQCLECPRINGEYRCTQCQTPLYAYDEETNKCIRCNTMKGCHLCYNMTRCDKCYTIKDGPDDNAGTCSRCADNCKNCRFAGSGKCDDCDEGFRRTDDFKCAQCIRNCRSCSDTTTCDRCNRGYFKRSSTECALCIENCDICSDANTCTLCFEGYYMPGSSQRCISCGNNCRKCDKNGKCSACKNGKISESGSCECASDCLSCDDSGFGKCDTCKHGFKKTADRTCVRVHDH